MEEHVHSLVDYVKNGTYTENEIKQYFSKCLEENSTKKIKIFLTTQYPIMNDEVIDYINNIKENLIDGSKMIDIPLKNREDILNIIVQFIEQKIDLNSKVKNFLESISGNITFTNDIIDLCDPNVKNDRLKDVLNRLEKIYDKKLIQACLIIKFGNYVTKQDILRKNLTDEIFEKYLENIDINLINNVEKSRNLYLTLPKGKIYDVFKYGDNIFKCPITRTLYELYGLQYTFPKQHIEVVEYSNLRSVNIKVHCNDYALEYLSYE